MEPLTTPTGETTPSGDHGAVEKLVAVVFSPLQALNLVEFSERFGRQVDVVVVGGASALEPASRTQIEGVLSLVAPRLIVYREWILRANRPFGARRAVTAAAAELMSLLGEGPYRFVVGEYRSAFSWAVLHRLGATAEQTVAVDDGTATLRIDRRRSLLASAKVRRQWLKKLGFLTVGVPGAVPSAGLTFFTTYSLEGRLANGDVVVRNDYRSLGAELRSLPPDDDSVYVIGGPYLEVGKVDEGDVELALDLAKFAAEYTGREVIYMAHRRERAEKLETLRKVVTVVVPNVPFEIYPRVIGKRPRFIVGYYSSLFVTAIELLGDSVEVVALRIPRDRIKGSFRALVDDIYRYYQFGFASSIQVVDRPLPPCSDRS